MLRKQIVRHLDTVSYLLQESQYVTHGLTVRLFALIPPSSLLEEQARSKFRKCALSLHVCYLCACLGTTPVLVAVKGECKSFDCLPRRRRSRDFFGSEFSISDVARKCHDGSVVLQFYSPLD